MLLLGLILLQPAVLAAGPPCSEACYQQKSEAYQRCRRVPPSSRVERVRCFQRADQALERCLRACR